MARSIKENAEGVFFHTIFIGIIVLRNKSLTIIKKSYLIIENRKLISCTSEISFCTNLVYHRYPTRGVMVVLFV